jgi:hypothetical protein
MKIRLVAVRAFVLALCVLGSIRGRLSRRGSRSTRVRGKNTAPSLLSNHVQWLWLLVRKDRRVGV